MSKRLGCGCGVSIAACVLPAILMLVLCIETGQMPELGFTGVLVCLLMFGAAFVSCACAGAALMWTFHADKS